ncbi:MAG: DUF4124 domain-containing protein [Proteobacteria bacterium]|nr:DUF4124 domain-containing protein [Pseudomonadota bacterium]
MMKGVLLTLCGFIALSSQANAARIYECRDKDGNTIITNTTPPPGAICESRGRDLTPSEAAAREIDKQTEAANDKIEALIAKLSVQTYSPSGQKHSMYKNYEQIVELRKAQLRNQGNKGDVNAKIEDLIAKLSQQTYDSSGRPHSMAKNNALIIELRKAQLRNQGSTPNGNQQDDMEDKMKRQQREMEDQKNQMAAQQAIMNAQRMRQQVEIQRLQNQNLFR